MRLAIADPPYPPQLSERYDTANGLPRIVSRSRALRWYGDGPRQKDGRNRPADFHPNAAEWDDPTRHRRLLEELLDQFDGWAIATSPDGLGAYHPLPVPARLLVWAKRRPVPTGHRITTTWEPVILYPPRARRARVSRGRGTYEKQVPDILHAAPPAYGFAGAKPSAWTHWVLDAMGYNPAEDTVADLFPGSGAVSSAVATWAAP